MQKAKKFAKPEQKQAVAELELKIQELHAKVCTNNINTSCACMTSINQGAEDNETAQGAAKASKRSKVRKLLAEIANTVEEPTVAVPTPVVEDKAAKKAKPAKKPAKKAAKKTSSDEEDGNNSDDSVAMLDEDDAPPMKKGSATTKKTAADKKPALKGRLNRKTVDDDSD